MALYVATYVEVVSSATVHVNRYLYLSFWLQASKTIVDIYVALFVLPMRE